MSAPFWCVLLSLGMGSRAAAADYTWDCNAVPGIQTCGGATTDRRFTTNGTDLVTWPDGTNTMVFAGDEGIWDISVQGTHRIGGLTVSKKAYTLRDQGALLLESSPSPFQIDADVDIIARIGGTGGFDKRGGATLTLSGRNDFAGAATVGVGTVRAGIDSFALGDTAGATTIGSGGTLDVAGRYLGREQLYLDGGSIVDLGANIDVSFRRLTVRANSTLGGSGNFGIGKGDYDNALLRVDEAATLTKVDTNAFLLARLPVVVEGRFEVGAGTLVVWSGTTFSGNGSYLLRADSRFLLLPDSNGLDVANDVRSEGAAINVFGDSLAGRANFSRTLTLEGAATTVNCLSSAVVGGTLAGSGRLRKWGDSALVLSGDNGGYRGVVDVVSGTVRIGDGGSTGSIASDSILVRTVLEFDHEGTRTFAGNIAGDGRMLRRGGGIDVFTGNLAHKGGTTIAEGTLQIGGGGSTGSISGTIVDDGTLVFDHASGTRVRFADSIRGTGGLVKRGSSVLVLGGRNSYTGATTVVGGKLEVEGALSGTNAAVAGGAALGGTGSISGSVSIFSGAILDPGQSDSAGILRTGALSIASGGHASFRVGTDSNHVVVDGDLTVSGRIALQAASGFKEGTYVLFRATGAISTDGAVFDSVPAGFRATLVVASGVVSARIELSDAELFWDCGTEPGLQPCDGLWSEPKFSVDSVHLMSWSDGGRRVVFAGADGSWRIGNKGTRKVDSMVFLSSGYRLAGDTIALAGGVRVASGKSDTLDSTILSGPGIVLDGGGTLVLRGGGEQAFKSLTVARGVFVATRSSNAPVGNKLGTGNVVVASGAALVLDSLLQDDHMDNPLRIAGTGSGKGALLFTNNRLGLAYEGPVTLDGDATIGSATATRSEGTSTTIEGGIGGGHDLTLSAHEGMLRVTGAIAVGGSLTTDGPDTVALGGANTYSGNTVVASGTMRLLADEVVPHADGKGILEVAGVLDLNGFDEAVNGLRGTGRIDAGKAGDTSTLSVGGDGSSSSFAGVLANTAGRLQLAKLGGGTLTLSGTSTFFGPARVDGGTLLVDGRCDSTAITVKAGAVLGGTGSTGAIVASSGTVRPGHADHVGVLKAARADFSGGDSSTLRVRAGGTTPGTDHDRLDLSGPLVLGGQSVLRVDLAGFVGAGTVAGIVRASSVSDRFAKLEVSNAAGRIVSLRYAETSVDLVVDTLSRAVAIDTIIPARKDSVFIGVGAGVVVIMPPREDPRRLRARILDSTLGRGISGADTALVLDAGASVEEPFVIRLPVGLVPSTAWISGEIPGVYRLDSLGKVRSVSSVLREDSTIEFVAVHDGAWWLGYDTIAPVVAVQVERDSLSKDDSTRLTWSMRDNVADAAALMCVLRAGRPSSECVPLAAGDSLEGVRILSRSSIPLGAAVRLVGRDARSVAETPWRDVVVSIDTLRASESREEDRYELVSFPYGTRSTRAHGQFVRQWGAVDPARWRAFAYDSASYDEIVDDDTLSSLGRAFWVRSRKVPRVSWVAGGWTWPVTVPVPVALRPGWNMVGDPYAFDVDWKRALELSGIDTADISGPYRFDGARQEWALPESSSTLRSWKGAALLNSSGRSLVLRIPSVAPDLFAGRAAARSVPVRVGARSAQGALSSARVWMGIDPACSDGCRIHPMPPSPAASLDLHLLPSRGRRAVGAILADIRGVTDSVNQWTVHVGGLRPEVPLVLEIERTGADTALPILVRDDKADRWHRLAPRMEFAVGGESKRTFTFLAGGDLSLLGRGGPFALQARGRMVRWCIPPEMGRTRVRIELLDFAGRRTRLLLDETMDAGSYARDLGVPATSSPGIVLLRAGGRVQSASVVRLR